jgi:Tol biopolymer transport system component
VRLMSLSHDFAMMFLGLCLASRTQHLPVIQQDQISRLNRDVATYRDPTWSPDSRYLAFASNRTASSETLDRTEIDILELETQNTTPLFDSADVPHSFRGVSNE